MKQKLFVAFATTIVASAVFLGSHSSIAQTLDPDVLMLKKIPHGADGYYHCDKMVHVVNRLRQLGKDRALAVMGQLLPDHDFMHTSLTIEYTCRLLFVNPNGWKPALLGAPEPNFDYGNKRDFPVFPFALSDGVPFLLVQGYAVGGRGPNPKTILDQCQGLSIIPEDLPLTGYDKAARDLIESQSFKQLCTIKGKPDARAVAELSDLILREAQSGEDKATEPTTKPDTMPTR